MEAQLIAYTITEVRGPKLQYLQTLYYIFNIKYNIIIYFSSIQSVWCIPIYHQKLNRNFWFLYNKIETEPNFLQRFGWFEAVFLIPRFFAHLYAPSLPPVNIQQGKSLFWLESSSLAKGEKSCSDLTNNNTLLQFFFNLYLKAIFCFVLEIYFFGRHFYC